MRSRAEAVKSLTSCEGAADTALSESIAVTCAARSAVAARSPPNLVALTPRSVKVQLVSAKTAAHRDSGRTLSDLAREQQAYANAAAGPSAGQFQASCRSGRCC